MVLSVMLYAQTPQSFSYQTVIRDANWNVLANQSVAIQISIIEDAPNGLVVYKEKHSSTTSQIGLVNLAVGEGIILSGDFTTIDWGSHSYFIQVAVDVSGGSNYLVMGSTQLRSVPYALYAETSGNPGPQGPIGLTGPQGPAGNDGVDGVDGAVGATGPQGPAGNDGVDGIDGAVGATGPQGPAGNDGVDGIDGIDAVVDYDSLSNIISVDSSFIANVSGGMGVGCNYKFPEGFNGEPITQEIINGTSPYTVPTGKHLYITHIQHHNDNNAYFQINGITIMRGLYNDGNDAHYPLILKSNDVLTVSNYSGAFNGFLIDAQDPTPITQEIINGTSPYTVPTGKHLYITHIQHHNDNNAYFQINGITIMRGLYNDGNDAHFPLILKSNDVLTVSNYSGAFNGYLADENYFAGCGGGGSSSSNALPNGANVGEMLYWNGNTWDSIAPGVESSFLTMGPNSIPVWTTPSTNIGSNYGGGIIGYIFSPSDPGYVAGEVHGYIYMPGYQEMEWGCMGTITGAQNGGIGQGIINTALIASICTSTNCAGKYCNDLVASGYDDWFLPTYDEANKAYQHLYNTIGGQMNIWLSEETYDGECSYCTDENVAKHLYQLNGIDYHDKNSTYRVYPVREF
jgi:hypothetical protein